MAGVVGLAMLPHDATATQIVDDEPKQIGVGRIFTGRRATELLPNTCARDPGVRLMQARPPEQGNRR
jgi:hypothetical protein